MNGASALGLSSVRATADTARVALQTHAGEAGLAARGDGAVVVDGVCKRFTRRRDRTLTVLDHLSLTVADGEFLSIIGRSGCGKSTLLEIVAGLQSPTSGSVSVGGVPVHGPGPDRTLVFQQYALFPWRTALQNVMFPMELAKTKRAEARRRALELLEVVGLAGAGDRYAGQLSGGMQQRVGLARALACDPRILLMDEPFSGADAITRETLQDLLKDLHRRFGKTIIFVTHSVDEALRLSDRIVVMGSGPGRILAEISRESRGDGAPHHAGGETATTDSVRDYISSLLRSSAE